MAHRTIRIATATDQSNVQEAATPTATQGINHDARNHEIEADRTPARAKCECGCGDTPAGKKSRFCPGHDAKLASAKRGPKGPTICDCGCKGETKGGRFLPGHDAKYHAAQKKAAADKPLVDLVAMCEQVA